MFIDFLSIISLLFIFILFKDVSLIFLVLYPYYLYLYCLKMFLDFLSIISLLFIFILFKDVS